MTTSTVLMCSKYGVPHEVVSLSTYELENLGPSQVLVSVLYAPINPADLNMLEGTYLIQPALPFVLGTECVGEIVACGPSVSALKKGDKIIFPFKDESHWVGCWAERFVASEDDLIKLPFEMDPMQASMMTVNPVTAYELLTRFVDLRPGDWILQNSGNSALGRWVVHLAALMGFQTLSLVRSERHISDLLAMGATAVLLDEPGVSQRIKERVGDVSYALNGVGGVSAQELLKALSPQGTLVTYGAMAKQPLSVGNKALIYQNLWLTGFNRSQWVMESTKDEVRASYEALFSLIKDHPLLIPVEKTYTLSEASEALLHAGKAFRSGKILFEIG